MRNRGRCASSDHSFSASNRIFWSQSCQFVCAKHKNQISFDSYFLLSLAWQENFQIFRKKAPIFPAAGGVAQKRKEFLRWLLKKFYRTCYTKSVANKSIAYFNGHLGQLEQSSWLHQGAHLSFTDMTNNFSQKFFLYARKSTDEADRQVLSIEAQLTEVREYAQKESLSIIKEFIESKSAKRPGREIFEEMLAGIENGEANGILAWHPDRLARNAVDAGKIIHFLDRGFLSTLKFPSFWFDKTPQGLFMLSIAFGQSKYYIDNLSENIKRGIRQKLRNGVYPGCAPIGYINELKNHIILKDQEAWQKVRKLFLAYATGKYTLDNLQKLALSFGLVSPRSKRKLSNATLQRILQNPFYYGCFQYKCELYEGIHEPIVSQQLFEKVQRVMADRGKPRKEKQDYNFAFTGIFKCGECGRAITAEQHIKKSGLVFRYYRCTKKDTDCKQKFLNENDLFDQLNDIFQKVALPTDWLKPILNKLDQEEKQISHSSKSFAQNLQKELGEVEMKLSKLLEMQLDGSISLEEYKLKKEQLINRKTELKQKLTDFGRKGNYWLEPMRNFILAAHQANSLINSDNLEGKRSFLQKIGSNWQLCDKKVRFEALNEWALLASRPAFPNWSEYTTSLETILSKTDKENI